MNLFTFSFCLKKLLRSWGFWLLQISIICAFVATSHYSDSPILSTCLTVFANVCYGYIAGYVFFIVEDFIPNKISEFHSLQNIINAEYEILNSTIVFEIWKLSESPTENELEYDTIKNKFICLVCENNPFEQCKDETIRLMSYWKINKSFISLSREFKKGSRIYFDLLLGSQSRFLSYEELESIIKIRHCLWLDFADYKDGALYAKLFDINNAFHDYYSSKLILVEHLKKNARFCPDKNLKRNITLLDGDQLAYSSKISIPSQEKDT